VRRSTGSSDYFSPITSVNLHDQAKNYSVYGIEHSQESLSVTEEGDEEIKHWLELADAALNDDDQAA